MCEEECVKEKQQRVTKNEEVGTNSEKKRGKRRRENKVA